jgi:hypothetical protein
MNELRFDVKKTTAKAIGLPKYIFEAIKGSIKKDPSLWITGSITLLGLTVVETPYIHNIFGFIGHMATGLLGIPTWELPQQEGLLEMLKTPEGIREIAKFVTIDGGLGFVAGFVERFARKLTTNQKEIRMLVGTEPINDNESPAHVFIGPSGISSDLAEKLYKDRIKSKKDKKPVVVVHLDDFIPARFGQEVDYHFRPNGLEELLGTFPPSKEDKSYIETSGIDRADEITFVCFNPDNAIFYGAQSELQVTPNFISTILRKIPKDKLKNKVINVIMNETLYIGQNISIEKELRELEKKFGFKLNIVSPQEGMIKKIEKKVNDDEIRNMVIVGQGEGEKDRLMLNRFLKATQGIKEDLQVTLITNFETLDPEKLFEIIKKAQLYLCYGDTDTGTSSLAELMAQMGVDRKKIVAIVERIGHKFDFESINIAEFWVIYEDILNEMTAKN